MSNRKPSEKPCIACASGNDLAEYRGDICAACGRGEVVPPSDPGKPEPGSLSEQIAKARGGYAITQKRGYA